MPAAAGSSAAAEAPSQFQLHKVFQKFDTNNSGTVDTAEMMQMVKKLNLNMSAAEVKELIAEADPDGSGEVDFREFQTALKKQLQSGTGKLGKVVSEGGGVFGWLNPLSWFGDEGDEAAASAPSGKASPSGRRAGGMPTGGSPAKASPYKPSPIPASKLGGSQGGAATPGSNKLGSPGSAGAQRGRSGSGGRLTPSSTSKASSGGGGKSRKAQSARSQVASSRSLSPTHRMKKTQAAVVEVNLMQAAFMRDESAAAKTWFREQQDEFLKGQHEKVLKGHQQAIERTEALEALKRNKRSVGVEMREQLEKKWKVEQQKKREYVEKAHNAVFDSRKKKQSAVNARRKYEIEQAVAIGEAAKIARAERREQCKATVRREEQAAREYTARVRYETRPEVRQDSAELFRRQRNAAAEELRQKHDREREEVTNARVAYLSAAGRVRNNVESLHASTRASREALAETRRMEAYNLRESLLDERRRKAEIEDTKRQARQTMHDEIRQWKVTSMVDDD